MAIRCITVSGAGGGTSWTDAANISIISSSANSGDICYIAGGTYAGQNFSRGGVSGNPVIIKRATTSDHGAGTGTLPVDAQVVFSSGIIVTNFVTLDGNEWIPPGLPSSYGILIKIPGSSGGKGISSGSNCIYRNIEISGPAPNTATGPNGLTTNGMNQTTGTTNAVFGGSNGLISGCKFHDMDTTVQYFSQNCTIEYTTIYNVSSYFQIQGINPYPHPDWCYNNQPFTNLNIRYCLIANVVSEGLFFDNFSVPTSAGGTFVSLVMYGCVLFQGDSASAGSDALEVKTQAGNYGAFYIYNNTFVDWFKGALYSDGPGIGWISSLTTVKNNLFVNSSTSFDNHAVTGGPAGDPGPIITINNGYGGTSVKQDSPADASPIINASNPFDQTVIHPWVSGSGTIPATRASAVPVGYDPSPYITSFRLSSSSWAINRAASVTGVPAGNFGVTYNVLQDMNGNTGTNLGAFQPTGSISPAVTLPPSATLVFNQDFTTGVALSVSDITSSNAVWYDHTPYGGDFGTNVVFGPGPPSPAKFVTSGGTLSMNDFYEPSFTRWQGCLLSSVYPDGHGFSQALGYWEAKILCPPLQPPDVSNTPGSNTTGLWPAFFLSGLNGTLNKATDSIEIDVLEAYSIDFTKFHTNWHVWNNGTQLSAGGATISAGFDISAGYHIYSVWVTSTNMLFYLDGVQVFSAPTPPSGLLAVFPILDLSLGGGFAVNISQSNTYRMLVQYVRCWSLGSSDTTPPTVSLTAPASGVVSGTITVSATASDNVAVAGVTFEVDGNPIQAEDTVSPYSISWNTASVSNGNHSLTAIARDTSSNTTTSSAVLVTTSNASTPLFVQVNSATPQSSTSPVSVVFTNSQTAGNANVVIIGFGDTAVTISSVNDSKGNVYTPAVPLARGALTGQPVSQAIYTSHNIAPAAAGTNTVTVTFSSAPAFPDIRVIEYANISTATVYVDAIASAAGTSTAFSSGSLTTTVINDMLVSGNTVGDTTLSAGGGFTQRLITADGDIIEDQLASTVGTYTGSATGNSSNNWVMQTVALKSAVSSPAFNPVTVNFTGTAATVDINYLEYRNIITTSPVDANSSNTGTSTTPSTLSFSTFNPSDILIGASSSATGTLSGGPGYTKRTGGTHSCVEDNPVTSTGSYSAASNSTVSSQWIQQAVALKAAGSVSSISSSVTGVVSAQAFSIVTVSVPIGVTGILSAQAFSVFSTAASALRSVTGIASSEAFTIYGDSAAASRLFTGIVSGEAFTFYSVSAPSFSTIIGITSGQAFSIPTVSAPGIFTVTGIPSAQAFGAIIIPPISIVTGILSGEAFSTISVLSPGQFTVTGIVSAEEFSTVLIAALASVTGVVSGEAFSTITVMSPGQFTVTGVSSAESFSTVLIARKATVTGITSAVAFGSVTITLGNVTRVITGVLSSESFPFDIVNQAGGPSTAFVIGIASSETFSTISLNSVGFPTRMIRIL